VARRLAAYGADSLDELTEQNARIILTKFASAVANRREANQSAKEA